jgi:hypothetical protein
MIERSYKRRLPAQVGVHTDQGALSQRRHNSPQNRVVTNRRQER